VIRYEVAGGVATILMDDPSKLNALSRQMGRDVSAAVALAEADPDVRCVVLASAVEKAFCSGADLKDPGTHSQDKAGAALSMFLDWEISPIARMRKPIIAAVNGICVGGGVEYLLACDIRIASEDARLWFTQTGLGIFPAGGGTSRLVRAIGLGRAMQMVLDRKSVV
jgi:enoyl-CoA hydratase/carnithine racemase